MGHCLELIQTSASFGNCVKLESIYFQFFSWRIKSATLWPLCLTGILPSTYCQKGSGPLPLQTPMWNGILPSTYLYAGSSPPPPVTTLLVRILFSTYLHRQSNSSPPLTTLFTFNFLSRIKSAATSDHSVEWDFTLNVFSWEIKSSPFLTTMLTGILPSNYSALTVPSAYFHARSHCSRPEYSTGFYPQLIFMRDQICQPVWPFLLIRNLGPQTTKNSCSIWFSARFPNYSSFEE